MSSHERPPEIGVCPECRATLTTVDVLIEYETVEGDRAVWADCPDCRTVVDPERS